jgi:hydrogenase expression/formation protein HypE
MSNKILLAHGSGGELSHELVRDLFAHHFANPILEPLGDAALLDLEGLSPGCLALTTDSYVVQPLFFPGGDIGKLAVCGTVNDLAVVGAVPRYLSAGFIIEEGLPIETLKRVVNSMANTARAAGVEIVTGDTKVVEKGAADGLFINTAGVGAVPAGLHLAPHNLRPGDRILINGSMGDHGMAVMMQREGLAFSSSLTSDCAPLNGLIAELLKAVPAAVRCMRDPTRGGLATTLNEWAAEGIGIEIEETAIPVRKEVQAICEMLGLDPLYAANEGKVVIAVAPEAVDEALEAMQAHPLGQEATAIGQVTARHPGRVVLHTPLGARRIVDMLVGAQLPRIC